MVSGDGLNSAADQNNDSAQATDGRVNTEKVDTTSFANIMAAVNRMRSEAAGTSGSQGIDKRNIERQSQEVNKRQKLPERVKPPSITVSHHASNDSTADSTTTLPPRVNKPTLPVKSIGSNIDGSNYRNNARAAGPAPIAPAALSERYNRPLSGGYKSSDVQTFNQIQVSRSQAGNPLLEYLTFYQTNSKIKDVDYVINSKCVALFLSLRYHKLHPEYIYNKLKKVSYNHEDTLRVLLVYVDIEDFQDTVRELDKLCLFNKLTLILAWTNEQCANYLQNLKYVEKEASKRIIQGNRTKDEDVLANEGKYLERVVNTVSSVKSVSQSDAKSLLVTFGSVREIIEADADQLSNIQGLGQLKVDRLLRAFNGSFSDRWN